jgi:hypothetical protein
MKKKLLQFVFPVLFLVFNPGCTPTDRDINPVQPNLMTQDWIPYNPFIQ